MRIATKILCAVLVLWMVMYVVRWVISMLSM